jgi:hypothetical protein
LLLLKVALSSSQLSSPCFGVDEPCRYAAYGFADLSRLSFQFLQ